MLKNISITAIAIALTASITSACEYKDHDINLDFSNTTPVASACDGVITAIKFFEDMGYDDTFTVNITVTDEVYVYMTDTNTNEKLPIRVFGLYNSETNQIAMSAWGTEYMQSRTAWNTDPTDNTSGMEITEEIWAGVITHETSHALTSQVYNRLNPIMVSNGYNISHGVTEFVAYYIQLATMRPELRKEIIESFGNPDGFDDIWNLNPILHFAHPHEFGVRAYNTETAIQWFHDALNGLIQTDILNF